MNLGASDNGLRVGRIRSITTLSPVIGRRRGLLRFRIGVVSTVPGLGRPLQDLAFIHFAFWAIVTELPPPDGEGGRRVRLNSAYLLFESNYDGGSSDYLDAFADRLPFRIEQIWSCCRGFREDVPHVQLEDGRRFRPADFKRYVQDNELEVAHFTTAYPQATTQVLRRQVAGPEDDRAASDGAPRPFIAATPVDPGRPAGEVAAALRALSGVASPLQELPETHVARFVVLPRTLQDLGQEHPDRLPCEYLLFSAVHDGSTRAYLRRLAELPAEVRRRLWGACAGYRDEPRAFAAWLARHALEHHYFVAGVSPPAPAWRLRELAAAHDGATGDEQGREPALADVQGNVLHAYGTEFPAAEYLLLDVAPDRAADARRVLARWSACVTFDRGVPLLPVDDERAHLNLAFTSAGLAALGATADELAALPEEYLQGAEDRAAGLGDRADSDPARWQFGAPAAHVAVVVAARSATAARAAADGLLAELERERMPLTVHRRQPAALLDWPPGGADVRCGSRFSREHFGFADGCSQPGIDRAHPVEEVGAVGAGVRTTRPPGSTIAGALEAWRLRAPRRQWRGVALGEFVLGFPGEDAELPAASRSPLAWGGTFMVLRKLEQDVPAFLAHTAQAAPPGMGEEEVRARIVGRWQDGTPLALSPSGPDERIANDRARANAFGYADDPDGLRCPVGAHVRRTNPRDGLPAGGEATMRHRIIRRGLPYGPPYDPDEPEEEQPERGLMFGCFSASIARGFETIQREWCSDGGQLGLGTSPDYLLQQRPAPGAEPAGSIELDAGRGLRIGAPPRPFVVTRGMEYLLLPGRSGLRRLLSR